jgi:3-(3-hydroxy-phenyl)propionate hydroxylase
MDAAARGAGADINMGWELVGLEQSADHVVATARQNAASGAEKPAERRIAARFLVGADGARSTTRELLGIDREQWPFRGAWLSIDAKRKRELPNFLGCSPNGRIAAIFCAPEGKAHSIIPLGKDVIRINFQIDPDVDRSMVTDRDTAYRFMRDTYGLTEDDVDVFRQAVHVFEGRLATRWRAGRVFIGGDAAHAMTPFMGQGGCSAFRDAINLSWKLDLVLRGVAGDDLLDTYEIERKPHARYYVDGSDKLGAIAFIDDPVRAIERDRIYLDGSIPAPSAEPIIETGLVRRIGGELAGGAGRVGPQGRIEWRGREGLFDDLFGWGFQVLYRGGSPLTFLRPDQVSALAKLPCAIVGFSNAGSHDLVRDLDGAYADFFDKHGVTGLIVRPDFLVFAGVKSPEDMSAAIDELIARVMRL